MPASLRTGMLESRLRREAIQIQDEMLVTMRVTEDSSVTDEAEINMEALVQQRSGLVVHAVAPPRPAQDDLRVACARHSTPVRPVGRAGIPRCRTAAAQGHAWRAEAGVSHPSIGQNLPRPPKPADQDEHGTRGRRRPDGSRIWVEAEAILERQPHRVGHCGKSRGCAGDDPAAREFQFADRIIQQLNRTRNRSLNRADRVRAGDGGDGSAGLVAAHKIRADGPRRTSSRNFGFQRMANTIELTFKGGPGLKMRWQELEGLAGSDGLHRATSLPRGETSQPRWHPTRVNEPDTPVPGSLKWRGIRNPCCSSRGEALPGLRNLSAFGEGSGDGSFREIYGAGAADDPKPDSIVIEILRVPQRIFKMLGKAGRQILHVGLARVDNPSQSIDDIEALLPAAGLNRPRH